MEQIEQIFVWFSDNEAGLSGVAALIVILGVLFSIFAGLRTFLVTLPKQNAALRDAGLQGGEARAAPLSFLAATGKDTNKGGATEKPAPDFDGPPSVAVLPFDCLARDDSLGHLSLTLQDDLISGMSQARQFPVISRTLVNGHLDDVADPRKLSEAVGAHYLVEGTIRPQGNEIRASVQLIEGPTGKHVWSGSFTGPAHEDHAEQSLAHFILGQLQSHLRLAEAERVGKADLEDLDIWGLTIRAYKELVGGREIDHGAIERSELAARRAVETDGSNASGHIMLAIVSFSRSNTTEDLDEKDRLMTDALERGATAVALAPRDPLVLGLWGMVLSSSGQSRRAIPVLERSVEIDSANPRNRATLGRACRNIGDYDGAIDNLEHALKLGPDEPLAFIWAGWLASAYLLKGDYPRCVDVSLKATAIGPGNSWAWMTLAAALGYLGKTEKARNAYDKVLEIRPGMTVEDLPRIVLASFEREDAITRYSEGLARVITR